MQPSTVTLTGTGATISAPVPLNYLIAPENTGWQATASGFTYTIAYSLNNPWDYSSASNYNASGTWTTLATGSATTSAGVLTVPARAIRVSGAGLGAADNVSVIFVQAGNTNG